MTKVPFHRLEEAPEDCFGRDHHDQRDWHAQCMYFRFVIFRGAESNQTENLYTIFTMFDFHDFGLIFAGQMHCLPQRLKSTLFEIFLNGGCPKGTQSVEKISNNVDFSL